MISVRRQAYKSGVIAGVNVWAGSQHNQWGVIAREQPFSPKQSGTRVNPSPASVTFAFRLKNGCSLSWIIRGVGKFTAFLHLTGWAKPSPYRKSALPQGARGREIIRETLPMSPDQKPRRPLQPSSSRVSRGGRGEVK